MPSRAKGRSRPKQSKTCCPGRVTALCLRVRNCLWKLCLRSCCQLEKPEPYCTEMTDVIEGEPPLCEETEEQQETQNVCSDAPYLLVSEERYRGGLPAQAGGCCNRKGHRVRLVVSGYHLHGDIVLHRPPQSPQLAEHTAPAPQSSPQPEGTAEVARAAEGPLPSTPPPAQPENLQNMTMRFLDHSQTLISHVSDEGSKFLRGYSLTELNRLHESQHPGNAQCGFLSLPSVYHHPLYSRFVVMFSVMCSSEQYPSIVADEKLLDAAAAVCASKIQITGALAIPVKM
ncbi:uncharacterized protein LOC132532855 [Erinaceus europaeus]|uniref:Uncharacterized protein LOC132532855 n=1 Tax=Erinaceus europaeus TaxID=9365 RepID=A0ABM3VV67_ERIEU|nr:uncharacterized protein LOC132532855 [Erinaceus europaeus]